MASDLYVRPWDGGRFGGAGRDDALRNADCLIVLPVTPGEQAAGFNRAVKVPHMNRKPIQGPWRQEGQGIIKRITPPSLPYALPFPLTQSRRVRYSHFPLILAHFFLPCSPSSYFFFPSLEKQVDPPSDGGDAEVGWISPPIPPLERITEWKWPQGVAGPL